MTPVEVLLAALLVASNAFWMLSFHRLTNKLMSRSFAEYEQARKPPPPRPAAPELPSLPEDPGALSDFQPL